MIPVHGSSVSLDLKGSLKYLFYNPFQRVSIDINQVFFLSFLLLSKVIPRSVVL